MTIRDIAIAIGFDVDDKSLKKAEKEIEKAKKRWEKTLQKLTVEIRLKIPKTLEQSGSSTFGSPQPKTKSPDTEPLKERKISQMKFWIINGKLTMKWMTGRKTASGE